MRTIHNKREIVAHRVNHQTKDTTMTTKAQLKTNPKKYLVQLAGYKNMKALIKDVPSMARSNRKAPSKKDIIKYLY